MNRKPEDRLRILGMGADEIRLIREAGQRLEPSFASIVDGFYAQIMSHEPLREIISRSTTTDRLKKTFHRYLSHLFEARFDDNYDRDRIQIGLTHHRVGLPMMWYLSMFAFLENEIHHTLQPLFRDLTPEQWIHMQKSVSCALKYDQLLAVDAYVEAYTAELRNQTEAAEKAKKSKSLFLATVSHELRTPLSSILGYTDLILDTSHEISPATRQHLQVLHRNANNLLSMINGLIEIGRVDSGKGQSKPSQGMITALLDDMAINAEGLLVGKPVRVERRYTAKSAKPVFLDFSKLRQVLLNLVSNACKFTDQGYIALDFDQSEHSLTITVRDSGPGIPEEERERIFEEFYRVTSSATKKPGSGLGLTLVKTLVDSMKGSIEVTGENPCGSVFTVKLPFAS